MAGPEVEAAWRAEITRIHDTEAFRNASDAPKAAFRWSGDEAETRRLQRTRPSLPSVDLRWRFRCYDRRQ